MKKCPFCKSDIEDNARFCVFCMSSLQEKRTINNNTENKNLWPYILAASLSLALIIIIVIFALNKNDVNNNTQNESFAQGVIINSNHSNDISINGDSKFENSSKNDFDDNKDFSNNYDDNDISLNNETSSQKDNKSNITQGTNTTPATKPPQTQGTTSKTDNTTTETTDSTDNKNNNNNSNTTDDTTDNTNDDKISTEQGNDASSNTNNSSENQSGNDNNTPVKTEAVYIYRNASVSDCYTEENMPSQPITNVIVITGVSVAASDGIYTIPEIIDGKKVGGIMPNAFCDPNISQTVKKVIVPTTVKTIWQKAFSSCYNLTDIYLCGQAIDIFETAFASKNNRTGTLTIHCSSECKNFAFYYYRNIIDKYGAIYQEWNGGDIE